ncbi:MAG TPA: O-antigen ligase family protein [Hyphomicrobiaceae bacterium]|nr:O-antigen ligase family protein [Hyphomicrobiaceae bacterium]
MPLTRVETIGSGAIFVALVAAIVLQPHMTVVLLPALALYAVPSLPPEVRRWPFSRNVVWVLPIVFALYVCASALWAKDARQALAAGALFALLLLSMRIVFLAIMSAESRAIERLGRVYVAAVATGAVLLAVTIFFDGVLHKALTAISPIFAPSDRDFVRLDGNSLQFVGLPYFNRNVALLNLLLWPALLLLWRRVVDLRSAAPPVLLFGVVAVTTFASEHQTSMLALVAASLIFVIYRLLPRTALILVMIGWVAALLLVRPVVLYAYDHDLQKASWLQESARARIILWAYTARQMSRAPVFGVGAQTTRTESEAGRHNEQRPGDVFPQWTGQHGHNIYIQTWYELGAVGAGLLLAIGLSILSWLRRLPRPSQDFAGSQFVLVSTMCASSFGMWQGWFIAACMLGILLVTLALREANCEPAPAA